MKQIVPYQEVYKEKIIALMKSIAEEFTTIVFSSTLTFEITTSKSYWVALVDNKVVGTIGIIILKDNSAILKNMFVLKQYRGSKNDISSLLLKTAIDWSLKYKINSIYLGTNTDFIAAQRFYKKNNFITISKSELPNDYIHHPTDDHFYQLKLRDDKPKKLNLSYRIAGSEDASQLARLRVKFLEELSTEHSLEQSSRLHNELKEYFTQELLNDNLIVWVAEVDRQIIASSTMVIWQVPIGFSGIGRNGSGYILNMYTLSSYRRLGIAKNLLQKLIVLARQLHLEKLHLHATDAGKGLYKKMGFTPPTYPELILKLTPS